MNWYAIYTKPKAEETVSCLLRNIGIETLAPKIMVKKCRKNRYVDLKEQLFPCYLFAFFDEMSNGHMVRYTRGVKYLVGKERPMIVRPEIIRMIRERMVGEVVALLPEQMESGDRVMIKEGPFRDLYGVFERNVSGKQRAMILLEALHFRLEVEQSSLRRAEKVSR